MRRSSSTVAVAVLLLVSLSTVGGGVVATTAGDRGPYQQTDGFDPNDDFDSAAPISLPFENADLVVSSEDSDFFAVELQHGDRLYLSVAADDGTADVDLLVYDPNRDQVGSSLSLGGDETVSVQAGTDGTYYVRVLGWTDAETAYSLTVAGMDGGAPDNDEFEYNDGLSSAADVSTPFEQSALRLTNGDVDTFAAELPANRHLNVTATFVHSDANVDLRVYGPNQELVATGFSTTDNETVSVPITEGGRHVVEVFASDSRATGYALSVSAGSTATAEATSVSTRTSTVAGGPLTEDEPGVTVPGFGPGVATH